MAAILLPWDVMVCGGGIGGDLWRDKEKNEGGF